jgi:hypothetical protein
MMTQAPSPNPVPGVGHFGRTLPGHFWRAAKPITAKISLKPWQVSALVRLNRFCEPLKMPHSEQFSPMIIHPRKPQK